MKRNLIQITSALLVCAAALTSLAQGGRLAGPNSNPALTDIAKAALTTALAGPDGEYAARAEYEAILDKFGKKVLPYAHLIRAEENHIAALQRQCEAFGVSVPEDSYLAKVQAPESLTDAAAAGILAEEANAKMYDELLKAAQGYPSLVRVFTHLQAASLNRHLPALKLAAANGGTVIVEMCTQAGCMRQNRVGAGQQAGPGCLRQGRVGQGNGWGARQQRRLGQQP